VDARLDETLYPALQCIRLETVEATNRVLSGPNTRSDPGEGAEDQYASAQQAGALPRRSPELTLLRSGKVDHTVNGFSFPNQLRRRHLARAKLL
jgi:hypothetical protein